MDKKNPYFFISGFISLSLFSLFLFLFFYMMMSKTDIKAFALKKDNYISISLDLVPAPSKKIEKKISTVKKEVQSVEEVKEIDIGDLFSDVWTKDIKEKKKKVDNKRLELIQKKIKKSKKQTSQPISELVTNNDANVIDTQTKKNSSGDEVNEYLAKIQGIIYKYFKPPVNSGGNTVKIIIELSAIGKVLDFRILTYSSNRALNEECDKIKERLLGVLFPINPENKSLKTIVNITSDK